jgi:hypothetical protein
MGAPARRAVVDLVLAIDGVIAAKIGIEVTPTGLDRTQHGRFLENLFCGSTSDESFGFSG